MTPAIAPDFPPPNARAPAVLRTANALGVDGLFCFGYVVPLTTTAAVGVSELSFVFFWKIVTGSATSTELEGLVSSLTQ